MTLNRVSLNDNKIITPPNENSTMQVRRVLVIAYRRVGKYEKSIKQSTMVVSADSERLLHNDVDGDDDHSANHPHVSNTNHTKGSKNIPKHHYR